MPWGRTHGSKKLRTAAEGSNTKQFNRVGYGWSGVLDAEAYVEGTVNDRSERSYAAPGFMKSGAEILRVEKSCNYRNRFKSSRSGVIRLGG
jgi:hypothetical protein